MHVVVGATGNVGRELVRELLDRNAAVRAMSRKPESAKLATETVHGDLDNPDSLNHAFAGADTMFLLSGLSKLVAHTTAAVDAARTAGVRRIVLMSSLSVQADLGDAIARWNKAAEELVRNSGLEWTILRAGAFMSNTLEWAESIRTEGVARILFGDTGAAPIDPRDIAAVAALAMVEDEHAGRVYPLTGAERITPAEQVRIIGSVLGRQLRVEDLPEAVLVRAFGWFGTPEQVRHTIAVLRRDDVPWAEPTTTVADLTGRAPRVFADWAREHVNAFR